MRKPSLPALKRKLWKLFSEYIRRRDADEHGTVSCISCGAIMEWKISNAGHFHPKSLGLQVYFVEKNVHNQCPYCNLVLQGNQLKYSQALIKRYGDGVIEELENIKNTPVKWTRVDYEEKISYYKKKLSDLLR